MYAQLPSAAQAPVAPSSQRLAPLAGHETSCTHSPVDALQLSIVHALPSSQLVGVAEQVVSMHSYVVHAAGVPLHTK